MHKRNASSPRRGCSTSGNLSGFRNWWIRLKDCSVELNYSVRKDTNTFKFDFDNIAGLHEHLRLSDKPDAARCPGGDDVARLERHHLGNKGDQVENLEDHVSGIRFLHRLPVQAELEIQPIAVTQGCSSDEVGSHRSKGIETFCAHPLSIGKLKIARRNIVDDR